MAPTTQSRFAPDVRGAATAGEPNWWAVIVSVLACPQRERAINAYSRREGEDRRRALGEGRTVARNSTCCGDHCVGARPRSKGGVFRAARCPLYDRLPPVIRGLR